MTLYDDPIYDTMQGTILLPTVQFTLSIDSQPTGITFQLDAVSKQTPFSNPETQGQHIIIMPSEATVNSTKYYFKQWENGSTNPQRTINLTADTALIATYSTTPPPPPPPPPELPPWAPFVAGPLLVGGAILANR